MHANLHIRPASAQDARAIRALIYRVGINPMSLDWRRFLVVVDDAERMVGCGQIKTHGDGSRELASIAVKPAYRGQGLARAIIERLIEGQPLPLYLTCRAELEPFYQKFGFESVPTESLPPYFRQIKRLTDWLSRLYPRMGRIRVMVKRAAP